MVLVDINQEVDQASKEEEDRDMEKVEQVKTESLDTFREEGSYQSTLAKSVREAWRYRRTH
jgi:hypothetical protein